MIAKGKSITHLLPSIKYASKQEKSTCLDKNIAASTPKDIMAEFKRFQRLNDRCYRNALSFVISPTIHDGQQLTCEDFKSITQEFLKIMKLQEHQYIAFMHENKAHKHIHLYVNRIDYYGRAYNDQFISNRAASTAESIARERCLSTAKDIQKIPSKQHDTIKKLAYKVLKRDDVVTLQAFVRHFNQLAQQKGIYTDMYYNKYGTFQGLTFLDHDNKYKACDIDPTLARNALLKTLENKQQTHDLEYTLRL